MSFLEQTLNGLSFAALLFLLGSGFALTFGLLRIVNIAHGTAFLVGGYVGYSTLTATGSFWLALLAGAAAMGGAGLLLERGLLRRVVDQETSQFLLTMGVAFVGADFALVTWGGEPHMLTLPGFLAESFRLGSITYPYSRVLIIVAAVVIGTLLWLFLDRTRLGAIIRAGVDNRDMVGTLGINVGLILTLVFVLGMALAGLAGVLSGTIIPLAPGSDWDILIYVFAIVVIGGRGTLEGAIAGSLVVGLLGTYGQAYFPSLAYFSLFGPMVVILLLRPQGLFGRGLVEAKTVIGIALPEFGRRWRVPKLALGLAVASLFAVVPQVASGFYTSLALNVLVFGLLAMSLDLLAGYTGLLSFGHAAYLGLGAYGIAYAEHRLYGPLTSLGFAVLVVIAVALTFGLIAVRVTGLTFGIVTMALGGVLWGLAFRWVSVSGGDNGLPIPARPKLFSIDLNDGTNNYYYFVMAVVIVCALLMRAVVRSAFGLSLRGIKSNEGRMRTLGYSVGLHKYIAYVLAGFFAGVAGMLYGFYNLYVGPPALDMSHNFLAVMMVVVGGLGTLWGGLVGSAVIVLLQQWVSLYVDRWMMVLGGIFVLTVLFARAGLFGSFLIGLRWVTRHVQGRVRAPTAPPPAPAEPPPRAPVAAPK